MTPRDASFALALLGTLGAAGAAAAQSGGGYAGLSEPERLLLQDGLAWSGDYLGTIDGAIGAGTVRAARAFQRGLGAPATGVLTPAETAALMTEANAAKDAIGYAAYADPRTGIEIGLPLDLAPPAGSPPIEADERASRFAASDGSVEIELFRAPAEDGALSRLYRAALDAPGREVTYSQEGRRWFVATGIEGDREFYTRVHARGEALVGFAIVYDTQVAPVVEPAIIAMSSAFARPRILDIIAEPPEAPAVVAEAPPDPPPPREPAAEPRIAAAPPPEPAPALEPEPAPEDDAPEAVAATPPQADEDEDDIAAGVFFEPGAPIAGSVAVSPQGHYLTVATVAGCEAPSLGNAAADLVAVDEDSGLALMQADTLEGALVGGFANAPAADGEAVTLTTAEAALAPGEVSAGASAEDALAIATDPEVEAGSPALDRYGRVIAILASGGGEGDASRPAVSLAAIQDFLGAQGVEPVVVAPSDTAFSEGELADSARLLTEMIYCDAPAGASDAG